MFLPHPRVEVNIVGSLRDREVACSASDLQGSNFESCVWRTVSSHSSHSSHHPQEVLLAQFSLYVHKGGLKPDSFHFHFRKHISQTYRACFYYIRDLRRTWKSRCLDLAKQVAVALVSSKLDYCNSLFYDIPKKDIARLQRLQNCLARVVTKAPRFNRSTPILKRSHWLLVKFRIHFKICTITFRNPERKPTCISGWLTCLSEILKISTLYKFK